MMYEMFQEKLQIQNNFLIWIPVVSNVSRFLFDFRNYLLLLIQTQSPSEFELLQTQYSQRKSIPFWDAYFTFHSEFSIRLRLNGYSLWLFEWKNTLDWMHIRSICAAVAIEIEIAYSLSFVVVASSQLKYEYDAERFEMQYGQSPGKLKINKHHFPFKYECEKQVTHHKSIKQ